MSKHKIYEIRYCQCICGEKIGLNNKKCTAIFYMDITNCYKCGEPISWHSNRVLYKRNIKFLDINELYIEV